MALFILLTCFYQSIIYLTDTDELIVIHSDESLDLSGLDYLDNEFSNLVSRGKMKIINITIIFTNYKVALSFFRQTGWKDLIRSLVANW
jgi:hypothetical protein